jgi:hypothetical protein
MFWPFGFAFGFAFVFDEGFEKGFEGTHAKFLFQPLAVKI